MTSSLTDYIWHFPSHELGEGDDPESIGKINTKVRSIKTFPAPNKQSNKQ
jgi:hypothetical protein